MKIFIESLHLIKKPMLNTGSGTKIRELLFKMTVHLLLISINFM